MSGFFESIQATALLMALSCLVFGYYSWRLITEQWQEKRFSQVLWVILGAGLLTRLAWIIWTQPQPLSDFKAYWDYAVAFRQGDFTFDTIIRHPGPAVLLYFATLILGPTLWAAWVFNLLLSVILMLLVFDLTRQLAGEKAGLLGLLLVAIMPQLVAYTALTGSELPSITYCLMFLWALMKAWREEDRKPLTWLLLSLLLYGTLMNRISNVLYLGLIPLVWLMFERPIKERARFWIRPYLLLAATTGVLLFSWMFHQYLVTNGAGFKLFYGSELGFACAVENADGAYMNPSQWSFYPKVAKYYETPGIANTIKAYEATGLETKRVIMADPAKYLLNGFVRMRHVLNTAQTGISWTLKGSPQLQKAPGKVVKRLSTLSNVYWQILFYGCVPLLMLGYRRNPAQPDPDVRLLAMLVLYFVSWFVFNLLMALSNERYGVQVMPFIVILFAGGMARLSGMCFSKRPQ